MWLGVPLLAALVSGNAPAQTRCGSVEQAWEQVAAYIVGVPFGRFGPWGSVAGGYVGLEGFESPGDMAQRCMEEAMPELPPVDDPRNYPGGEEEEEEGFLSWLFGDPHLATLDDQYYDFHGAGDYVLLAHDGTDVEIQGRFVRAVEPRATVARSLAVRVGERVVTFHEGGGDNPDPVSIDGRGVPFLDAGTFRDDDLHVQRFRQWLMVRFRNGLSVATVGGRTILVRIPAAWAGDVSGLLGNADGDPANDVARRDGTVVDPRDTDTLYGGFLDDWLVTPADSLFTIPFDEAARGPIRPEAVVTLDDLPADDVATAAEICAGVGLPPGPVLDGCVFDVALTGDPSWATADNAVVGSRQAGAPAPGAEPLNVGVLTPGDPIAIEAAAEARRLRWSLAEPGDGDWFIRNVDLRPTAEDVGSVCAVRWTLLGDDDALADGSFCVDVPNVDARGALGLTADVPAGVEGSFVVGVVASGADVETEFGDRLRYGGELQSQGQIDTYTFNVEPGTRLLLLDPVGENACGIIWRVAAGNDELFRGASCFDTDPVAVTVGGEVAVSVEAGTSPGRYGVEIVRVPAPRTRALAIGEPLDASIDTPGQSVRFTFDGTEGDELVLAKPAGVKNICQIVWRIIGPRVNEGADDIVFEGPTCFDTDPIVLTVTGPHLLEIDGNRATTGAAAVSLFAVREPRTEVLRFGTALDASIDSPGARVRFTFTATAGDELLLRDPGRVNANCQIVWRIVGPDTGDGADNVVFEAPVCFDAAPVTLAANGSYVVEVRGRLANTGTVSLVVERR
jgi:hypothetical protein